MERMLKNLNNGIYRISHLSAEDENDVSRLIVKNPKGKGPEYKLMEHYRTMGFETMPHKMEQFVYSHVKPIYDKDCRFMYQKI